jgi:hypothetical protein
MFRYTLRDESNHIEVFRNLFMDLVEENREIWTADFKEELRELMREAVTLEKEFIRDCLPVNAVGLAADEFITTVTVTSCSRFNFHDNVVETPVAAAHSTKAINLVSALDARIVNNIFRGLWSDSTIFGMTGASLRLMILDNVIYNEASGAGAAYCGIDPGALATTGIVKGNVVTALYATAVAKTFRHTATVALMWNDNSWANAVAERGVALPATSIV